jgi:ubiquinone/menaquinone biosynthesis C-methylase UbiE
VASRDAKGKSFLVVQCPSRVFQIAERVVVLSPAMLTACILALALCVQAGPSARNTWQKDYAKGTAESFAARFEDPSRALFRYRAAIAGLMQIKPGMTVAEIGAGSGYLARFLAEKVGPGGRVIANELEPKMVAYMNERAAREGLKNFKTVQGNAASTGFEAASIDAMAVVYAFSFFDQPAEMLASMNASLKPNGLLLIVDVPREGIDSSAPGMDAEEVVALASAAGFNRERENGVVPGHYALIFRKR